MSEYFRAAAASGWQPKDREVLRHHGLAAALVRQREQAAGLPPREVLLRDAGEDSREALRQRLAQHVTAIHEAEVEAAAARHRSDELAKQRRAEAHEAELRAVQQLAREKAAAAAATSVTTKPPVHTVRGGSATSTPKQVVPGGVPPRNIASAPAGRRGPTGASFSVEQRRRLREKLGASFLFESDDEDEEAAVARLPKTAADDVVDYSRPQTASSAPGFREAAAELSALNVDEATPELVFAGAGAAAVARRHRVRPRSSLSRKALDATLRQQLKSASASRPSSAAVSRVTAATFLSRTASPNAAFA